MPNTSGWVYSVSLDRLHTYTTTSKHLMQAAYLSPLELAGKPHFLRLKYVSSINTHTYYTI